MEGKLTRYEFGGTGIFHALNLFDGVSMEAADGQDIWDAERNFDELLPLPEIFCGKGIRTESWFTEKGLARFRDDIAAIRSNMETYLGEIGEFETRETARSSLKDVLYEDEWQVVAQI